MPGKIGLRRAVNSDAERLLQWRNDPDTRHHSLTQGEISYDRHVAWLSAQLGSDDVALFIIEDAGQPCGQIRLNRLPGGGALISIGLAREARGRGLGSASLRALLSANVRPPWAAPIYAVIKVGNTASRRAFEAAGYRGPSEEGAVATATTQADAAVWVVHPALE